MQKIQGANKKKIANYNKFIKKIPGKQNVFATKNANSQD